MTETEDIPYNFSEFATPEDEKTPDEDQANKSVIQQVIKFLDKEIEKHNTLDVIEPNAEAVMTTQQQVVVHQNVVNIIRDVKNILKDKLEELV